MLSGFLKKLLFARQFVMNEGKIEVLGKQQIMLPWDVLMSFEAIDHEKIYSAIKTEIKNNMGYYAKKLGASSVGMLNSLEQIFETFGLGKLQIVKLDNKNKVAIVRIYNNPFKEGCQKKCSIHCGSMAGMFSFLFKKEVDAKNTECVTKNKKYCEFKIE